LPHPDAQETITYTFKTYEDYFIDYFNLPVELYTRDETTGVVTIDYTKITRKTANGETGLSYNDNVFYTVTSNDLTGTGSQTDPYIVHSTNGFLYLTNNSLSKIALGTKYIELNCNIVLNDETFDQDGNPSGGDGKVYLWSPISCGSMHFNGNEHVVYGLTLRGETNNGYAGLFGNYAFNVSNLNFENVYINKFFGSTLGGSGCIVENCHVLSGTVTGNNRIAGLCGYPKLVTNSSNNATIIINNTVEDAGGICVLLHEDGSIENCDNYGRFLEDNGKSAFVGGIVSVVYARVKITNCNNYGDILLRNQSIGGICCNGNVESIILNCNNYGKIIGRGNLAGIMANSPKTSTISNCGNFGYIKSDDVNAAGQMVAIIELGLTVENCRAKSVSKTTFIGYIRCAAGNTANIFVNNCEMNAVNYYGGRTIVCNVSSKGVGAVVNVHIENSKFIISDSTAGSLYVIYDSYKLDNLTINNVKFYCKNKTGDLRMLLSSSTLQEAIIKNTCIDVEGTKYTTVFLLSKFKGEGILINIKKPSEIKKQYYGADFSGFYVSWRTGKIGLVALDGRGSFQGTVDEEFLKNKGYEKKSIWLLFFINLNYCLFFVLFFILFIL